MSKRCHAHVPSQAARSVIRGDAAGLLRRNVSVDDGRGQQSPPASSVDELKSLAATLQDEGKRNELLSRIQALIAAQQQAAQSEQPFSLGDEMLRYAADATEHAQDAIGDLRGYFGDWPVFFDWLQHELTDPQGRIRGLHETIAFIGIFVAGWTAELLLWRLLTGTRRRLDHAAAWSGIARILPIAARTILDLLPLAAFAAAAFAIAVLLEPTPRVRAVGLNFVNAYLMARGLMAMARMLLAPTSAALRLLRLADSTARGLYIWFRRFVGVGVGGYFLIGAALLLGLPRRGSEALLTGLGLIIAVLAVVFVLRYRRMVANWLRLRAASASQRLGTAQLLRGLAAVWHVPAIAYIIGFFVVATFRIEGGFAFMLRATLLSIAVLAAAWLLLIGMRRLLIGVGEGWVRAPEAPPLRRRVAVYLPVLSTVLRLTVMAAAVLVLLEVWGIGVFDWIQRPWGQRALGAALSIGMVLAFAVVVWELASSAIGRYLERSGRDGSAVQHSARIRTLLPLLRKALFVFLSIMVVMITLSELGIDIAPLLAGAGVVGLAIGFGAQKLVQDVITGVFMLIEDALAVGDVVNVAGVGGVVEDMSIRSIRLRDMAGSVHTVPFSSVGTVTNLTKDFSYYVLDISVAYRENVEEVTKSVARSSRRCGPIRIFAADILEPLEVFGIDQFLESAVVVKARIKTRPIRQWAVGREFNGRMKKRFEAEGIEIPFPHRTIYLGVDKRGEAPPLHLQVDGRVSAPPAPASTRQCPSQSSAAAPPPARRDAIAAAFTRSADALSLRTITAVPAPAVAPLKPKAPKGPRPAQRNRSRRCRTAIPVMIAQQFLVSCASAQKKQRPPRAALLSLTASRP